MKINRTIKFKNKLLNLKIIKTKIYKNFKFFDYSKIENTNFRLKKALNVIHEYHTNNKQILFIITSLKLTKKLLQFFFKKTKHLIIPETLWVNGTLSNRFLNRNNNKTSKCVLHIKKKPDLIVILNQTSSITALKEGYKTKIPTISLNCNLIDHESSYKIPGDFKFTQKQIRNNFFYDILIAILKKKVKVLFNREQVIVTNLAHKLSKLNTNTSMTN